jgi:hypothetical protein
VTAGDTKEAEVETDERQELMPVDEVIRWLRLGRTRHNPQRQEIAGMFYLQIMV